MNITYTVHSAVEQAYETNVKLGDHDVQAMVRGLVVELVSTDQTMSRTIRIPPQGIAAGKELYVVGATILTSDSLVPVPVSTTAPQES